jgi:hypothetical protein
MNKEELEILAELREMGVDVRDHRTQLLRPKFKGDFKVSTGTIDHVYFMLDKRKAGKQREPLVTVDDHGVKWTVVPDEELGAPGPQCKPVLRAIERYLSEYLDVLGALPSCIPLRLWDMARAIKGADDVGGSDVKNVKIRLELLSRVLIIKEDDKNREQFRIIDRLVCADRNSSSDDIDSFHFLILSSQFLEELASSKLIHNVEDFSEVASLYPLSLAIYEKLLLQRSHEPDINTITYDYPKLAKSLGVRQEKYVSLIYVQLGKHFDLLKGLKRISSWRLDHNTKEIQIVLA